MNTKDKLIAFAEGTIIFIMITTPVLAAVPKAAPPGPEVLNPTGVTSPITQAYQFWGILKSVLQWTYTIFFMVAVIFILFAAYNFLFAKGDPEKIKEARKMITWAAIAIAIALISVAAAQIVQSFIGTGTGGQLPTITNI